ncbi:pyridoxamine 5'-phosphate oxidase family protein [Isoptericola sp. NEAU-Y5]|uniref:Pyridoxamine 5'-phosphate oxidase family protein n=1 Tax=Isoptericola luteus TaxID=2879484 RepID=A0ABS7ZBB4_9MICO|nr:pyridoxamine 5'-phosphate oxidase family protein [Isoptericola sp. NEAU-Y5]MCA5891757.1 pyridoxamine 5'-phosphate oxidase family protein [Isoptericola sp. NEAU-Y5]MCA5894590.1 pyridoxamine 5'-phosphate oxidase family protein [Isoptericola sp. NEAU-Y5]
MTDLTSDAARVLATVRYVALATIDPDGAPRVSPVFFTRDGHHVYWVSSPAAHHSRNVEREPRVEGVVFDSTVRVGSAEAVYLTGRARRVPDDELGTRCAAAYADTRDGVSFTPEELAGGSDLRLYLLEVDRWEVLVRGRDPERGTGTDRRVPVPLG